jgi:hypothetical protein
LICALHLFSISVGSLAEIVDEIATFAVSAELIKKYHRLVRFLDVISEGFDSGDQRVKCGGHFPLSRRIPCKLVALIFSSFS